MNQRTILIALAALLVIGGAVYAFITISHDADTQLAGQRADTATLTVTTSTAVLEEVAKNVGGTYAHVISITQSGVDAHDFEPTPRQVAQIRESDLFVYNGTGLDPWAQRMAPELKNAGIHVFEATSVVELQSIAEEEHEHGDEHAGEEEDAHKHEGEMDPHVWLSPTLLQQITRSVQDTFIAADPEHAEDYRQNADQYIAQLQELDQAFKTGLVQCQKDTIIVSHNAFGYLGQEYGFEIEAISGISPESEPSTQRIAQLTELAREKNITVIFFETLTSPRLSETIAREIGAQTLVLNPIEGFTQEQREAGETYTSLMQENLRNLQTALECSH